jgi:hypothetical protein
LLPEHEILQYKIPTATGEANQCSDPEENEAEHSTELYQINDWKYCCKLLILGLAKVLARDAAFASSWRFTKNTRSGWAEKQFAERGPVCNLVGVDLVMGASAPLHDLSLLLWSRLFDWQAALTIVLKSAGRILMATCVGAGHRAHDRPRPYRRHLFFPRCSSTINKDKKRRPNQLRHLEHRL